MKPITWSILFILIYPNIVRGQCEPKPEDWIGKTTIICKMDTNEYLVLRSINRMSGRNPAMSGFTPKRQNLKQEIIDIRTGLSLKKSKSKLIQRGCVIGYKGFSVLKFDLNSSGFILEKDNILGYRVTKYYDHTGNLIKKRFLNKKTKANN